MFPLVKILKADQSSESIPKGTGIWLYSLSPGGLN